MDAKEFEAIWKAWYPRLRVYAAGFAGLDAADREDCVQEILMQAYRQADRYNPRYAYATWIYRIARSRLIRV
jgi:RNA polymerase sigma factor (sigma-70 family)